MVRWKLLIVWNKIYSKMQKYFKLDKLNAQKLKKNIQIMWIFLSNSKEINGVWIVIFIMTKDLLLHHFYLRDCKKVAKNNFKKLKFRVGRCSLNCLVHFSGNLTRDHKRLCMSAIGRRRLNKKRLSFRILLVYVILQRSIL